MATAAASTSTSTLPKDSFSSAASSRRVFTSEDTLHLHGHPLPACKALRWTHRVGEQWAPSSNNEDQSGVAAAPTPDPPADHNDPRIADDGHTLDLFLLSLSRPVLVFAFPRIPAAPSASKSNTMATEIERMLQRLDDSLPELRRKEPDLEVFGITSAATAATAATASSGPWQSDANSSEPEGEVGRRLNLKYPLLSDPDLNFSRALSLFEMDPTSPSSSSLTTPDLCPLLLLFREGQVVRVDADPLRSIQEQGSAVLQRLLALLD